MEPRALAPGLVVEGGGAVGFTLLGCLVGLSAYEPQRKLLPGLGV